MKLIFFSTFAVVLAVVLALARSEPDNHNLFMLQFVGGCHNNTKTGNNTCSLKAPSQRITSTISVTDAVDFSVMNMIGTYAVMNSTITTVKGSNTTLLETGTISFGTNLARNHTLLFSTTGYIWNFPERDTPYVYSWAGVLTNGTGAFANARGSISYTSYEDDNNNTIRFVSVISSVEL